MFASQNLTAGQLNAIVKLLGGEEAAHKFLRHELVVSEPPRLWRKENDLIYFKVTSDGTTGPQWIERLERKCFNLDEGAREILLSPDFKPTSGVTTRIVVYSNTLLFRSQSFTEDSRRRMLKPDIEVACLIRESFSDKEIQEMGFEAGLVIMHEACPTKCYGPALLVVSCYGALGNSLRACVKEAPQNLHDEGFAYRSYTLGKGI